MDRQDDQQLWDLLGEASSPAEPSMFFARNVLREIREGSERRSWLSVALGRRIFVPASVAFATLLLTFAGLRFAPQFRTHHRDTASNAVLVADEESQNDDLNLLADADDDNDDSQVL